MKYKILLSDITGHIMGLISISFSIFILYKSFNRIFNEELIKIIVCFISISFCFVVGFILTVRYKILFINTDKDFISIRCFFLFYLYNEELINVSNIKRFYYYKTVVDHPDGPSRLGYYLFILDKFNNHYELELYGKNRLNKILKRIRYIFNDKIEVMEYAGEDLHLLD